MRTKQLLVCLVFLISTFAVNVQAQQNTRLGPHPNYAGKEALQQPRRVTKQSSEIKKNNRYIGSFPAKAALTGTGEKMAYGYRIYDEIDWPYYGIVQFSTTNPGKMNVLFQKEYTITAGAYARGNYYVYKTDEDGTPPALININLQDGKETILADLSDISKPKSMTYDYSTETMYLLQWKEISKINLSNGTVSDPISLGVDLIGIACSYDGRLYGIITETSELVEINPLNGKLKTIGRTGVAIENMYQSLDFDHESNTLYWAGYGNGSFLATINLNTGAATVIGTLGNNSEIAGLYVPFSLCPAKAPAEVMGLKAEPDKNGGLSVALSWENPKLAYDGSSLTELTAIKIYRDGLPVKTIAPVLPGKTGTYVDQVPANGKRLYKIMACNAIGEGAPKYYNVYAGQDHPMEVTGIEVSKNEASAVLSWKAPAAGANNGWFDLTSVKYKITRYPDQKVLEAAYSGKESYVDSSISGLGVYSYSIEAFNTIGYAEAVNSPQIILGNHIIPPYNCDFSSQPQFNLWTVIDNNNDKSTWSYSPWDANASYPGSYENDADDWLISSPVQLEAGKYYKMIVELDKPSWLETHENIRVTMGTEATVGKQTTILAEYPDFSAGVKSINVKADKTGEYYMGIQCYSLKENLGLQIKNIRIVPSGLIDLAAVSVVSTDSVVPANYAKPYTVKVENKGATTVFGYNVSLVDADGNILCTKSVEEPIASNSTANVVLEYTSDTEQTQTIFGQVITPDDSNPGNNQTSQGQAVEFKKTFMVSGKIVDLDNKAISGVFLKMKGFRTFITETSEDGTFEIPEVYSFEGYELQCIKNGFVTEKRIANVAGQSIKLNDIQMNYSLNKPAQLTITENPDGNMINWADGANIQEFRYDNGIIGGAYGSMSNSSQKLVGSVYERSTRLTGMSWVMDDNSGQHETVNLYVLALNKEGKPTSKVLFSQRNVPNTDTTWGEEDPYWNHFSFPYPIEAPYGFFVAVGCDQPFSIYVDDMENRATYPFMPLTHYTSEDYTTNTFSQIEEVFFQVNLFIRAEGVPMGANQALRFIKGYKVWRLLSGNENNPATWQELSSGIQTSTIFNDLTWKNAPQGVYRYAVRTEYLNGKSSDYTFSEKIQKEMLSAVSIKIKTNTTANEAEGAVLLLKNKDKLKEHQYQATLNSAGEILFAEIWKGNYDVIVRKGGFELLQETLEIKNASHEFSFVLKESVLTPYNLSLSGQFSDPNRTFYWNLSRPIEDDFESHDDFEINSEGKVGWKHIDGDNTFTYGIGDGSVTFPNQNKRMAYIIFNPSMSTPAMIGQKYETIQPHSGNKFLAFIASSSQIKENDDYLISPELNFEDNFKFKFYARTCNVGLMAEEQMRVGYSLTGTQLEDFEWLTVEGGEYVPVDWTQYVYDIPANAKYVTINYISFDMFMLMIDDVFIGYEDNTVRNNSSLQSATSVRDHTCEVYLDGNKVGQTKGNNYAFTNLTSNNKTVGVRTVYASGSSELITIDLKGSSIAESVEDKLTIRLNPADRNILIEGAYKQAELFDASGTLLVKEQNTGQVSVRTLVAGIYLLRVTTDNGAYTQKISLGR